MNHKEDGCVPTANAIKALVESHAQIARLVSEFKQLTEQLDAALAEISALKKSAEKARVERELEDARKIIDYKPVNF